MTTLLPGTAARRRADRAARFFAENRAEVLENVRAAVNAARATDDDLADHVGTAALIIDDAARVYDYVAAFVAGDPPPLDAGADALSPAVDASLFVRVAGAVREGLVRARLRHFGGGSFDDDLGDDLAADRFAPDAHVTRVHIAGAHEEQQRDERDDVADELVAIGAAIDEIVAAAVSTERAEHDRWQAHGDLALAKLDALLAASPAGIAFVDTDLRYRRVNEALASVSGKPVDAHIGRRIDEVLPKDAAFIGPVIRHILETGERMTNVELRVSSEAAAVAGSPRHFLGSFFPVRAQTGDLLGAGMIVVEMTDVKEAQAKAERTAAELATVLDNERFLSEASQVLFSALEHDVTLAHLAELAVPRLADECSVQLLTETGGADRAPVTTAAGTTYVADLTSRGRTLGAIRFRRDVGGFDVTDIAVMDELARRAGVAVDNAELYEQARRAVRTREEVLAIVSHDLKNPLTAVGLAAAWLHKKSAGDVATRSHIETIQRAARRMERLISDLLDMASIQAGKLAVLKEPDDIAAILKESVEEHRPVATSHDVTLVADIAPDLAGLRIPCDRRRIVQLLGNLIGNAIKFSPAGAKVTVRGARSGAGVAVAVVDEGPGVPDHQRARLFEPFWSAPEHAEKGTGLGLTIAKGIVDSHGGSLRVDSEVGRGASFTFTLPLV